MKVPSGVTKISTMFPGPTVAILAGIHGNERPGILALRRFLRKAHSMQLTGTVYGIFGNPVAIRKNVRFVDANLNRCFRVAGEVGSYEKRRAKQLIPVLRLCSTALDLHASNTPKSIPFLITERQSIALTATLSVAILCHGFDRFEPGSTEWFMHHIGRKAVGVECGYKNSTRAIEVAERTLHAFLQTTGNLATRQHQKHNVSKKVFQVQKVHISTKVPFRLHKNFQDFAKIRKGQVVGYEGSSPIHASLSGYILFARNRSVPGQECFLLLQRIA